MIKDKLERMKQRNEEARSCIEKAERCLNAIPVDMVGADMFLNDARANVGLVQMEINQLSHEHMSDDEYKLMQSIVAIHASLSFKITQLGSRAND